MIRFLRRRLVRVAATVGLIVGAVTVLAIGETRRAVDRAVARIAR